MMHVRSPKQEDTKHGVTFGLLLTCFLFWILYKFNVSMIGKTYCFVHLCKQTSKIDCFHRVHKFCDESGLAILRCLFT